MFSAEDAERSGALTDTRAFNAVCDDLGRAQQEADDLRALIRNYLAALDERAAWVRDGGPESLKVRANEKIRAGRAALRAAVQ